MEAKELREMANELLKAFQDLQTPPMTIDPEVEWRQTHPLYPQNKSFWE